MKLKQLLAMFRRDEEVVARFGQAALIRQRDGSWKLRGGSRDDRSAAREYISLFLHQAVITNN